ncbi:MAG: hypothetical protein AVDCRST_MAG88-2024, partial [uncultured Thermomicrobiales bacterium]
VSCSAGAPATAASAASEWGTVVRQHLPHPWLGERASPI